jgi:hypothetical protein
MLDLMKLKRAARRAMSCYPYYRLIPIEKYRDYAATTYLDTKGPEAVCERISLTGRIPRWKRSTFELALRAAFECGDDRLARDIGEQAKSTFPESALALIVLSDAARYHGNYGEALELASRAWFGDPASDDAASRVVELAHRSNVREGSDGVALAALQRFPCSSKVLWAVCKGCSSEDYFKCIHDTWRAQLKRPSDLALGVRQMANAAIRAEQFDAAIELYSEGCLLELRGLGVGKKLPQKQLAGKNGLYVIRDLVDVLRKADIPFFLAAGTALGVIRNGRPLDHDNDIDIGIFEEHWNRDKLIETFRNHARFDFDTPHPKSTKIGLVHRGGAAVDIFRFYKEGESIYHDAVFVRWKNSPFSVFERHTASSDYFLPEDEDRYLSENYGDWRTPDSTFDAFVDGPNVEVTWPEYFLVHRMRRAYKYFRALDLVKARDELSQIKDALLRSKSGTQLVGEMQF